MGSFDILDLLAHLIDHGFEVKTDPGQPQRLSLGAQRVRLAHEFHTLVIDYIPVMRFGQRNEAKRFIILIDTLYDHAVKLVASASADPDRLYLADEGYEAQEFKRTASRLIEMRSESYLALPHGRRDSQASVVEGIVET